MCSFRFVPLTAEHEVHNALSVAPRLAFRRSVPLVLQ